jgi:hypothetical protein
MSDKMYLIAAVAIFAALVVFDTTLTTPAFARWWDYPNSGYCPPGTCNAVGGWRALNVRNCRPAYCARQR